MMIPRTSIGFLLEANNIALARESQFPVAFARISPQRRVDNEGPNRIKKAGDIGLGLSDVECADHANK
jgi:hypothetical protein